MKPFIHKILIFSLIILTLIAAGETYVRSIPNPARYKHQWMLAHSTELETLILGSSHCFYGIDPAQFGDHAFNIAQPTQPYRYDWYQLTHYPLPRLKTVVLPFSYQSLFEDLEAEPRLRYWAVRYRLYMDCDIHSPLSLYGLECLHMASFKEKLTSLWRPAQLKWDTLGFGTTYANTSLLTQGKDNGLQRAEENTYRHTHSLAFNTAMLDSIATWCDSRGVRLLLITTPVSPSFRQHSYDRQIAINDSTLQRILSRHPSINYHDYWADTTFVAADFYDADHLNLLGARKLTKKVIKDLHFNK
ncbi:MAG: SGNH/GDSL hydrolase family protein [Bacteroidaceae bacterium]|nr:SGNH/GDSL hydrolase family protein [Bacteroidaceae bacterium]